MPDDEKKDNKKVDPSSENKEDILQMYIGGFTLVRDGGIMACAQPAASYQNLSYANVQGMWRFLQSNEAIQAAALDFQRVVADELTTLGDSFGLLKNRITTDQLAKNNEMLSKL